MDCFIIQFTQWVYGVIDPFFFKVNSFSQVILRNRVFSAVTLTTSVKQLLYVWILIYLGQFQFVYPQSLTCKKIT